MSEIWHNIGSDFSSFDWAYIVRLVFATVLGGLVGLEREVRDKPAGFRTIILICVGSCLFAIISQSVGGPDWDSTRIAAQIVSGIGFLGAGAILRDRGSVFGLTTAATIWAVAAIGMAVGFGELALGVAGAVAILSALFLFDSIERWIGRRRDLQEYHILAKNTPDRIDLIKDLFYQHHLRCRKYSFYEDEDSLVFHIVAMGAKINHNKLRSKLASSSEYTLRRH